MPARLNRLLKERAAEDHLFGDKERFVTAAYKAKLEADQKWQAEERVREALEAKNSVVKAGHMGNFYRWPAVP
jgi:coiled-coil domain-containing protein 55